MEWSTKTTICTKDDMQRFMEASGMEKLLSVWIFSFGDVIRATFTLTTEKLFILWNKGYSCIKFSVRNIGAGTYETKKANSSRSLWKALHSRWHHIRSQCSQIFAKKIIFYSLFKEDFRLILFSDADWVDKKNQIFEWFCFLFWST